MAWVLGMATKQDFFEDMATALDSWSSSSALALADPDADLTWTDQAGAFMRLRTALREAGVCETEIANVLSECLRGLAVSFFTILDGGTKLAEDGRIYIVDQDGNRLGEGLHDEFVSYLIESGRMR